MMFDYSITRLKCVRCSNHECQHVFKVYDRREPVINDPGFVVVKLTQVIEQIPKDVLYGFLCSYAQVDIICRQNK